MNPTRRQFLSFLAPLAVMPVIGPHMLLSDKPTWAGWRRSLSPESPIRLVPGIVDGWNYQFVALQSVDYYRQWGWERAPNMPIVGAEGGEILAVHIRRPYPSPFSDRNAIGDPPPP